MCCAQPMSKGNESAPLSWESFGKFSVITCGWSHHLSLRTGLPFMNHYLPPSPQMDANVENMPSPSIPCLVVTSIITSGLFLCFLTFFLHLWLLTHLLSNKLSILLSVFLFCGGRNKWLGHSLQLNYYYFVLPSSFPFIYLVLLNCYFFFIWGVQKRFLLLHMFFFSLPSGLCLCLWPKWWRCLSSSHHPKSEPRRTALGIYEKIYCICCCATQSMHHRGPSLWSI